MTTEYDKIALSCIVTYKTWGGGLVMTCNGPQ